MEQEKEKRVEYIELFYDVIFVFCISRLTKLLEPMTHHFDDFSVLPSYFMAFAGILQRSYWHITLAAYFLVLGISRVMVSAFKEINEKKTMKRLGFVFLFMAVVISGMIRLCIREGRNPSRTMISAIAQATYAFVLIGIAIFNIIRSHRRKDDRMIMIRSISMASAIGSMLSLERVMLGTFSHADTQFTVMMEAYSGFGAFAIIVLLGNT